MSGPLIALVVLLVAGVLALAWSLCRMAASHDADEAHTNLARLLAEQADQRERADERAIADNLDL